MDICIVSCIVIKIEFEIRHILRPAVMLTNLTQKVNRSIFY